MPQEHEETDPTFAHHAGDGLPTWNDSGVRGRLIAGEAFGLRAAVHTFSPLFYAHLELAGGARVALPDGHPERALYVASGAVEMDGTRHGVGDMLVVSPGSARFAAVEPSTVMMLGGEPLGERFFFWNFVSSSKNRLEQAKADWQAGRMKLPDFDNEEFIPLPVSPSAPPNPMS